MFEFFSNFLKQLYFIVIKPSSQNDQYSKFEIDSFTLKFTNKKIESSFTKKKIKNDAKFHKFFLFLMFLSFLSFQTFYVEKTEISWSKSDVPLYLFTIFLFFSWICSLSEIYEKKYFLLNGTVHFFCSLKCFNYYFRLFWGYLFGILL